MRPLPSLADIDRLLIVKTSSIGDVIHALPIAEEIKAARPSLSVGWVVRRRCASVLRGNPVIDHLHTTDDKPSLTEYRRLRKELKPINYQCALDMQGLFLSGLITRLSGAPVRIGLDRNREGNALFMTHPIVPGKQGGAVGDRHAVDILYGFAEALGVDVSHGEFAPQSYLSSDDRPAAEEWLRDLPHPRIALNVGASWLYKRWPEQHWVALARGLLQRGCGLVFVGDKRDAVTVAAIRAQLAPTDSVVDVSGRTDLRHLAALLASCDQVVSADTGPMHLAVAVGTPVVALFGATNPLRTGPYGKRHIVLNKNLPCAPCYRNPTCAGRVDCMQAITPADVLAVLEISVSASQSA